VHFSGGFAKILNVTNDNEFSANAWSFSFGEMI
jgi:hypothetical protein